MPVPRIPSPRPLSLSALFLSGLLGGCAFTPGLGNIGSRAPESGVDTSASVSGVRVHLRSLTPAEAGSAGREAGALLALPDSLLTSPLSPYRLGLYDVVTVTVWEHPELTSPLGQYRSDLASGQMVDASGNLFYPYAGLIPARGLTTEELRQKILASLSKVLNNPQLDVKVTGFRSQRVQVEGAVEKPGAVEIGDVPVTLLDAVAATGGVATDGDASRVVLERDGSRHEIDLYGAYAAGRGPGQVVLRDGDVLRVPDRSEAGVYVLGEVPRPAAVPLRHGRLSLVQALAEVGGLSPLSAQSKGVYVVRLRDSSALDVWHLDARNPLALALADRFPLRPRDLVYVDGSGLARWNRVVNLLLPTAQLWYYGMVNTKGTRDLLP